MREPHIWQLIQRWMDGQVIRVNQSQLADAIGVGRQTITQWKRGETRPSPENLRRLASVTRIPYSDLTDALLRDLGYVTDEREDVGPDVRAASTRRAGESPADDELAARRQDETPEADLPWAAHPKKGRDSEGRRLRRAMDEVGEENQDPGE